MRSLPLKYYISYVFFTLFAVAVFYDYYIPTLPVRFVEIISISLIIVNFFIVNKFGLPRNNPIYIVLLFPFVFFEIFYPILKFNIGGLRLSVYYITPYLTIYYLYRYYNNEKILENIVKIIKIFIVLNLIMVVFQYLDRFSGFSYYKSIKLLLSFFYSSEETGFAGTRATGVYLNSTGLAISSLVAHLFIMSYKNKMNFWMLANLCLIFFSGSRVVIFIVLVTLVYGYFKVGFVGKFKLFLFLFTLVSLAWSYGVFDWISLFLDRFLRIIEYGILNDYSLNHRIESLWGPPIEYALRNIHGTVYNPVQIFEVIDSGYVTYFSQGGIPFILFLFLFLMGILCKIITIKNISPNFNFKYFSTFIFLYIIIAMVISNPMRDYLVIICVFSIILYPKTSYRY